MRPKGSFLIRCRSVDMAVWIDASMLALARKMHECRLQLLLDLIASSNWLSMFSFNWHEIAMQNECGVSAATRKRNMVHGLTQTNFIGRHLAEQRNT